MTGYELITEMPNEKRAHVLGVSYKEAADIKLKNIEELRTCEHICLETMRMEDLKGNCREKLYCCYECRKEFLENEITGVQGWG